MIRLSNRDPNHTQTAPTRSRSPQTPDNLRQLTAPSTTLSSPENWSLVTDNTRISTSIDALMYPRVAGPWDTTSGITSPQRKMCLPTPQTRARRRSRNVHHGSQALHSPNNEMTRFSHRYGPRSYIVDHNASLRHLGKCRIINEAEPL